MNTDKIAIFLDLAETLSFSRTAVNMDVTQSAVSQSISSLEKYLGTKLFYRNRRSVTLTMAGRSFYESIHPAFIQFNKSIAHAKEVANSERSILTIGTSGLAYDIYLATKYGKEYHKQNPNVKIFYETHDPFTLVERLKQGFCDVIFSNPALLTGNDRIIYHKLVEGTFCAFKSKDYNFEPTSIVYDKDLAEQRLIFVNNRYNSPELISIQRKIASLKNKADITVVENMIAFNEMVKAGLGIGISSDLAIFPNDDEIELLKLDTLETIQHGIAYLQTEDGNIAQQFTNWVIKQDFIPAHPLKGDN